MKINLRNINCNLSGFEQIAEIHSKTKNLVLENIEINLSTCSFFAANMVAPFYTVISRARDNLNDITIENLPAETRRILQKNHFLKIFNFPTLVDTNQTTLPFKIFKLNTSDQFNDYLDSYMQGRGIPIMSEALTKRFRQSLFEIFFNATLHSKSKNGVFVCGQFFPQKHRMDFTIADAGVGIRENVRSFLNININSCKAIEWALVDGNTTKSGGQPGGLGLKLIKDFIKKNEGKLQIISRFGYYELNSRTENYSKMDYDFPGTVINIEINTNDTTRYYLRSELSSEDIF